MESLKLELLKKCEGAASGTNYSSSVRTEDISSYRKRCQLIIGIDPDVDASGVAVLNQQTRTIYTTRLSFPQLSYVLRHIGGGSEKHLIVIELDRYCTHDFHVRQYMNVQTAAKVGFNHGRNYEVGAALYEIADNAGLCKVIAQTPLVKCWKGPDRKITEKEMHCIRGIEIVEDHRTNQEERDAFLLAVHHTYLKHWYEL